MSRKPIIVIAAAHDIGVENHFEQYALSKTYALAVAAGGAIPVLAVAETIPEAYAAQCDGLVLTGGWPVHADVIASGYISREEQTAYTRHARDPYDISLFHAFRQLEKPVLGICRGHQYINIAQNGDLNYDIAASYQREHRDGYYHMVKADKDSVLGRLYGEEFLVNSYHNYHIQALGDDLRITAWSPDGLPEALEHVSLPIFGVQWHPERMRGEQKNPPKGPDMTSLFEYLTECCVAIRDKRL